LNSENKELKDEVVYLKTKEDERIEKEKERLEALKPKPPRWVLVEKWGNKYNIENLNKNEKLPEEVRKWF